jgi:hypothetical protein
MVYFSEKYQKEDTNLFYSKHSTTTCNLITKYNYRELKIEKIKKI